MLIGIIIHNMYALTLETQLRMLGEFLKHIYLNMISKNYHMAEHGATCAILLDPICPLRWKN